MKKISILLIAFLLLGSFAFAQEGEVDTISWEVSASATNTFGVDLEEGTTGFRNEATASLTVTIVPQDTVASDGDGWYGWIELADFQLTLDPDGAGGSHGTVTAQITDDVVYVQIYSAPRSLIDDFAPPLNSGVNPTTDSLATDEQGLIIGYGDGPVNDLSLRVFSFGGFRDGVDDPVNVDNKYGIAVNADVQVDIIQIQAGVSFAPFGEEVEDEEVVTGLGGKVTADMTEDGLGLTFYVGSDVQMYHEDAGAPATEDHTVFIDIATGLSFGIAPGDDDPTQIAVDFYFGEVVDWDDPDNDYGNVGDLQISFTEVTAGGLAPNVGFGATVSVWNLLAPAVDQDVDEIPMPAGNAEYPLTLVLALNGEYSSGGLRPFFNTEYRMAMYDDIVSSDWVDEQDPGFDFTAGLELGAGVHGIQNTTFTFQYEGIELLNEDAIEQYFTIETSISL